MDLANISTAGWVTILIIGFAAIAFLFFLTWSVLMFLSKKNIKTKFFEATSGAEDEEGTAERLKEESLIAEGKEQLENQCHVASQILKELRSILYERGLKKLELKNDMETRMWRMITYRTVDGLAVEVRADLMRNHLARRSNYELAEYARAKARGYFSLVKDWLYKDADFLPGYDLVAAADTITAQEIEELFRDVYFSARRICAEIGEKQGGQ